jgi:hypothetical protein
LCRQQNPKNSILMMSEIKQRQPGLNGVIFYRKRFYYKYSNFVNTRANSRP